MTIYPLEKKTNTAGNCRVRRDSIDRTNPRSGPTSCLLRSISVRRPQCVKRSSNESRRKPSGDDRSPQAAATNAGCYLSRPPLSCAPPHGRSDSTAARRCRGAATTCFVMSVRCRQASDFCLYRLCLATCAGSDFTGREVLTRSQNTELVAAAGSSRSTTLDLVALIAAGNRPTALDMHDVRRPRHRPNAAGSHDMGCQVLSL